ncbi:MAG: hypothetical protein ACOC1F_05050 [Myxococcota bacterium]
MHFRLHRLASSSALLALLSLGTSAHANHFAPDGSFLFEPDAAYTEGFEEMVSMGGDYQILTVDDALEGTRVFSCHTQYETVDLAFELPDAAAVYEATLWIRGEGMAAVLVAYADNAAGDFSQLFPTGRMTSDGWMELRSAPFSVDGPRDAEPILVLYGQMEVDAVEVHPSEQVSFSPPQRCEGIVDPTCTGERVCLGGWCRNPLGWVPPAPEQPEVLADYLENRIRFFFGPYLNRDRYLDASFAETATMGDAPSRWRFWNGFATAVRRLRDSHSSVRSLWARILSHARPLNACFTLGDGDLSASLWPSHTSLPDVLVSHAGQSHHWDLGPGDRLVAVDGKHPIAWMQSLIAHDWSYAAANDPTSLAMEAEALRSAIPRYARAITVIRCDAASCSDPEEILVKDIPEVDPEEDIGMVGCDHRPQPLVASQPDDHFLGMNAVAGPVLSTDPNEKIYGLVWDYLITQSPADGVIDDAVAQWRTDARGVVLDHRMGNGGSGPQGSTSIADPILAFVLPPTLFGVSPFRQAADESGPKTVAEGLDLVKAHENAFPWRGGGPNPRTDVPVALLITRDVSFSDLFPYAFSRAERVRIFGPNPTQGAFSTFFGLSYWLGFNYQLAGGDVISSEGVSLCGRGAAPHQVVFPKQSDLVAGVDTLAAEALAWIRAELEP